MLIYLSGAKADLWNKVFFDLIAQEVLFLHLLLYSHHIFDHFVYFSFCVLNQTTT